MFQAFAKEREMSNLKVGDKVYAKHKNTRYYKATVVKIERQIFCLLDFDDGSFSDDTFPEDIVVCFITVHVFLFTMYTCRYLTRRLQINNKVNNENVYFK